MNNALLIAINTLKVTFRKKGMIIILLVLPIVSILLSMVFYGKSGSSTISIGVIDKDNSHISQEYVKLLSSYEKFKIVPVEQSSINSKVASGNIDGAVVIPSGFGSSIYAAQPKPIEMFSIKGAETTGWVESYTNLYIKNLSDIASVSNGSKATFDKIYEKYKNNGLELKVNKLSDQQSEKRITLHSLGFLIMFIMFTAGNTAEMILKEKRSRTYYRIYSSPVTGKSYLAGNLLANLVILFIQIFVVLVAASLMGIETYIPLYQLLLVLLCFVFVAISLGMTFVSFSKDSTQANTLANLIIMPTSMLGGCFWTVEAMPKSMQKVADFIPQKWALDAIRKLQTGSGLNDILIDLAIILAFALALFLVAAYKFRRNDSVKSVV